MAACLEATDPLGPTGDTVVGALGPIPRDSAAILFGVRVTRTAGATHFTSALSAISQLMGMGYGNPLRVLGRYLSPISTGYGLGLIGIEIACAAECERDDVCRE